MHWKKSTGKMRISSEVKVGFIGIVSIAVLIWGINYLKGRNILSRTYTLYACYPESGGLEPSAPVLMNGVKIGYVDQVKLQADESPYILTALHIEKEYPLPEGTVAELFSADLIGTKAIRMVPSAHTLTVTDMDTLGSAMAPDLFGSLQASLFPVIGQIGRLAEAMDTLVSRVDSLLTMNALPETLDNLAHISNSLNTSVSAGGPLDKSFRNLESFTSMLESQKAEMAALIGHMNSISTSLDSAGLGKLAEELHGVSHQFNQLLEKVNSGEGSAGKFVHSDSLHDKLEVLVSDLDILIRDLKENPEDYVQISVFGKSGKKK